MTDSNTRTPLQASKWLQVQLLVESQEMESLLNKMGEVFFYSVGRLLNPGEERFSKASFLENYTNYLQSLKSGDLECLGEYRICFSSAASLSAECVFSIEAANGKQVTRACLPIVQTQLHMMGYSILEKKFRPMVLGKDSIHWGLQFSYPQLFQDPFTKEIEKVLSEEKFLNTRLFRAIQTWVRENTLPTPFIVGNQRINVPMRLGKKCFDWINQHPQLAALGIGVEKGKHT